MQNMTRIVQNTGKEYGVGFVAKNLKCGVDNSKEPKRIPTSG